MSYQHTSLSGSSADDAEPSINAETTQKEMAPKNSYAVSIWIMILINFLDNVTFAISIPSLWYFVAGFGASKEFYGWCVAVYSIGQFVGAPLFGFWSNHRPYREVMIATLALEIVANVLYSFSVDKWMIFSSRLIIGFAGGNIAVTRSYISATTTTEERASAMGYVAIAQVLGFVAGPAIGAGLAHIPDFTLIGPVRVDAYTWPGYFGAALAWVSIWLLIAFLKEIPSTLKEKMLKDIEDQKARMAVASSQGERTRLINAVHTTINTADDEIIEEAEDRKVRIIPVAICMITYFISVSGFVVFETIGSPFTKAYYGWDVVENGLMYVGASITSIIGFITVKLISRWVNARMQLIIGTVIMTAGFGALIQWGSELELWRWLLGCAIVSFGLPMSQALVIAIFSTVIHKEAQGTMMGYMVSSASLASILAPIWCTYIYQHVTVAVNAGASTVFIITGAMMAISLVVLLIGYRKLTPHPSQQEFVPAEKTN